MAYAPKAAKTRMAAQPLNFSASGVMDKKIWRNVNARAKECKAFNGRSMANIADLRLESSVLIHELVGFPPNG